MSQTPEAAHLQVVAVTEGAIVAAAVRGTNIFWIGSAKDAGLNRTALDGGPAAVVVPADRRPIDVRTSADDLLVTVASWPAEEGGCLLRFDETLTPEIIVRGERTPGSPIRVGSRYFWTSIVEGTDLFIVGSASPSRIRFLGSGEPQPQEVALRGFSKFTVVDDTVFALSLRHQEIMAASVSGGGTPTTVFKAGLVSDFTLTSSGVAFFASAPPLSKNDVYAPIGGALTQIMRITSTTDVREVARTTTEIRALAAGDSRLFVLFRDGKLGTTTWEGGAVTPFGAAALQPGDEVENLVVGREGLAVVVRHGDERQIQAMSLQK